MQRRQQASRSRWRALPRLRSEPQVSDASRSARRAQKPRRSVGRRAYLADESSRRTRVAGGTAAAQHSKCDQYRTCRACSTTQPLWLASAITLSRIFTVTNVNVLCWLAGALLVTACSKPPPPPPPAPRATPKPVPTPHPARAATEAAMRMYPDLRKRGSALNVAFREVYDQRLQRDPASLAAVDWPLSVAEEAAKIMGVSPHEGAPPNLLERGAYNQRRVRANRSYGERNTNYPENGQ
jgi:hypothetical protein